MERRQSPRLFVAVAVLVAWTALLTLSSAVWTRQQFEVLPAWDHALYLSMSLRFHRALEERGAAMLARQILHQPSPVAPLFPLTTVPLYRTLGESREVAQLTLAPMSEALQALSELREKSLSPSELESFVESTRALDDEAFVDAAYREWLRREPDPAGRTAYVESLGGRSRMEVIESILRSEEFRLRPLRVLVVPDHRVFNAATLQYLAESERRALSFRRATRIEDLAEADAAILKEGGPQGPWPNSIVSPEILETIETRGGDGAGFPCPDGSRILVLPLGSGR